MFLSRKITPTPKRPPLPHPIMLFAATGVMQPHHREDVSSPLLQKFSGLLAATALRKYS